MENPETDDTQNPTDAAPDASATDSDGATDGDRSRPPAGREMLVQLQQMIDTLATQAAPVMREVAAKSAELAAIAAEKAGPLAYKAADATQSLGQKVATRSKEVAADLRRPPASASENVTTDDGAPGDAGLPHNRDD